MLTIRREQMVALEAHMTMSFREKLLSHVRQEFHEESAKMTDPQVLQMIDEGIRRSRTYAVTSERDVTLFVDLMFAISPRFEDASDMKWAQNILLNPELEGTLKMELIYKQLAARQAPPENPDAEP
jgi:hypothetical protein